MKKAIIGGTGIYNLDGLMTTRTITTVYGKVEVDILCTDQQDIVFLARHGRDHGVPPHLINYRANMMALKQLEVDEVFATCAVGSMRDEFGLGEVVVLKDFMDFTKSRIQTFFDEGGVKHVIMSEPYCPSLSQAFTAQSKTVGIPLKGLAVYVCTEGPRFETAAEIAMYRKLGGDVVGMTNVPECILAKELGMCYSAVGIVTNWCTGIKSESMGLHDINSALAKNKDQVTQAFISILSDQSRKDRGSNLGEANCHCANSLISL